MTKRDQLELLRRGARTGLTGLVFAIIAGVGLFVAGTAWTAGFSGMFDLGDDLACHYLPSPDGSQQSMTPNGRPIPEPSDHLILPLILKTDNSDKRQAVADRAFFHSDRQASDSDDSCLTRTSVSAVNSRLARQFTLVGAKPSGTG